VVQDAAHRESWVLQAQQAAPRQVELAQPSQGALALRVSQREPPELLQADVLALPEGLAELPLELAAYAKRLSRLLLLRSARLPRRFPRPLHLADGA
jgi:hypothetical protein